VSKDDTVVLHMPAAKGRTDGELVLELFSGPRRVFDDRRPLAVLPPTEPAPLAADALCIFDPQGKVAAWLRQHGQAGTSVASPDAIPSAARVLLVGPNAIISENRSGIAEALRKFVAAGNTVIVWSRLCRCARAISPWRALSSRTRKRARRRDRNGKDGRPHGGNRAPDGAGSSGPEGACRRRLLYVGGTDQLNYRLSYAHRPPGPSTLCRGARISHWRLCLSLWSGAAHIS